jgi:hypothetical protein
MKKEQKWYSKHKQKQEKQKKNNKLKKTLRRKGLIYIASHKMQQKDSVIGLKYRHKLRQHFENIIPAHDWR